MRERRKAPRYAFGLTGLLHRPGEMVGSKVVVRVISTVGCAVEGAADHGVGKECELYFDWNNLHVGVVAEVASRDSTGRVGLKFLSLDREMQSRLRDICEALRARAMAVGSTKQEDTVTLADSVTTTEKAAARRPAPAPASKPEKKRERRRVPRYASDLPAQLSAAQKGAGADVTLITLSVLGGCLEGSHLPEAGQPCELTADWQGRQLKMRGNVVWNRDGKSVGITFTTPDQDAEKLLRQICSGLRLQPLAPLPPEP